MIKNYSKKIAIAAAVGIVVVAVFMYFRSSGTKEEYETMVVEQGTILEEVSVTGSIAPMTKVKLQPEVSGKVKEILVTEGDEVEEGDVLLKLDAAGIEAQIRAQQAALASARSKLNELQAGATAEDIALSESAVDTAQSKLDAAVAAKEDAKTSLANAEKSLVNTQDKTETLIQSEVDAFLVHFDEAVTVSGDAINRLTDSLFTGSDQLAITSSNFNAETDAVHTRAGAKSALVTLTGVAGSAKENPSVGSVLAAYETIQADLATVKLHLEAVVDVLNHAAGLSSSTLATYQANANTALSNVNTVIQKLTSDNSDLDLQQKLNDADITAAEIALSNAEAALTTAIFSVETSERALAQAEAELELKRAGSRPEVISSQQAKVNLEAATLSGLMSELEKRMIKAPFDAVVTLVAVEVGEAVQTSQVAVIVNTVGRFDIIANISEIDIAQVSVGNPVRITLDAFGSDEEWTGKVIAIQPAEKVVEGIIFYETTIRFDVDDPRLRSGMTANLEAETGRREGALVVPLRAVHERDGKYFVEVMENGVPVLREISLGLESLTDAEVLNGLTEGETIVVMRKEE